MPCAGETVDKIALNVPSGTSVKYPEANIKSTQKDDKPLMPALAGSMSEQDLVDLVEYLSSLKK